MQKVHYLLLLACLYSIATANAQNTTDNFVLLKGAKNYPFTEQNLLVDIPSFYISPTQVTYGQMAMFAMDNAAYTKDAGNIRKKPEDFKVGAQPAHANTVAVNVNWFMAIRYANWLSEEHGLPKAYTPCTAENDSLLPQDPLYWDDKAWQYVAFDIERKGYRLPTEAEWEYAASGYEQLGKKQKYAGTDDDDSLNDYAWYYTNSTGKPRHVGTRKPNPNRLYDMSGNAWEWCWDEWQNDEDLKKQTKNKEFFNKSFQFKNRAKIHKSNACLRGGSWNSNNDYCAVAYRYFNYARYSSNNDYGFRLFRTP